MKHIKMLLYGEPGVGKSVFASHAPKPFFIATDGNYEWLTDFGADPDACAQVSTWGEAKKAFDNDFEKYDTVVVDLLEDLFKWCETEFCLKSKIDHVSDVGYGKGYDITRNEFFFELTKLIAKPKHIIFITHSNTFIVKDRRGVDHTKYAPSSRIPDKVLDMIEGRVRYCLRCYTKAEESKDGSITKRRYISLIPKENEPFGVIRGVNENDFPTDIDLDWNTFVGTLGLPELKTEYISFERNTAPKAVSRPVKAAVRPETPKVKETPEKKEKAVKTAVTPSVRDIAESNAKKDNPFEGLVEIPEEAAKVLDADKAAESAPAVEVEVAPVAKPVAKAVEKPVANPVAEAPAAPSEKKESTVEMTNKEKIEALKRRFAEMKKINK